LQLEAHQIEHALALGAQLFAGLGLARRRTGAVIRREQASKVRPDPSRRGWGALRDRRWCCPRRLPVLRHAVQVEHRDVGLLGTSLLMIWSIDGCEIHCPVPVPSIRAPDQMPEVPAWWLPLALSWARRMLA
jgi:hypothetical protein